MPSRGAPDHDPPSNADGRGRGLLFGGLVVALLLAGIVSFYASSTPDGLEKVAGDKGFLETAQDHDLADSALADYAVKDVDDSRVSVGLAGVIGVVITFVVGLGVFMLVRLARARGTPVTG